MRESELKIITDDTLKELRSLDVITPDMYTCAFESKLKKLNSSVDLDTVLANGVFQNLDKIFKLQKETSESTQVLKDNIDIATTAIDEKDEEALKSVKEHMITLQKRIMSLEGEVYIDDLTKVYNRKWIYDKALNDGMFKDDGVLTFIDLDKFKAINDSYGHIAGDKVLFLIANLLGKIEGTEVARLGGDEFILFSKNKSIEEIQKYLNQINHSFETKSLKFQGNTFKISISFGSNDYKSGEDFQYITEKVDHKMYECKREKKEKELIPA